MKSQIKPSAEDIEKLTQMHIRNPNNSKYGLNITKVFDTFIIKKQTVGEDYIFGYYDNLADAEFVRNFLMDHDWNINEFNQIEFDMDTGTYKIVEIIKNKVYIIDSIQKQDDINLNNSHSEFLSKILKHKYGLSSHNYLSELTELIPYLEDLFNVKAKDDVWLFDNISNPLNDVIFKLTPFQKVVYDAIDGESSFEDIKNSIKMYKSKNFDEKISDVLNDLIDLKLITKKENIYKYCLK